MYVFVRLCFLNLSFLSFLSKLSFLSEISAFYHKSQLSIKTEVLPTYVSHFRYSQKGDQQKSILKNIQITPEELLSTNSGKANLIKSVQSGKRANTSTKEGLKWPHGKLLCITIYTKNLNWKDPKFSLIISLLIVNCLQLSSTAWKVESEKNLCMKKKSISQQLLHTSFENS